MSRRQRRPKSYNEETLSTLLEDGDSFNGFKVKDVAKDGNCLFRTMAYHLFKNDNDHLKLRSETVEFIINNKQEFIPKIAPDNPRESQNPALMAYR